MAAWQKLTKHFQYFARHGIKWVAGAGAPGQGIQSFPVTGGGTGTDVVTFANKYRNGEQVSDMADTSYEVFLGYSATPAGKFVGSKTTAGFTITGLGAEAVDVLVVGRLKDMPDVE